ncbi:hypothetical protein ACLOJK_005394 [Asimina triloba]
MLKARAKLSFEFGIAKVRVHILIFFPLLLRRFSVSLCSLHLTLVALPVSLLRCTSPTVCRSSSPRSDSP